MAPGTLDAEVTIFAAPKHGMKRLYHDAESASLATGHPGLEKMLKLTSGGLGRVEIGAYDGFLLHGLFLIPPRFDRRHSAGFVRSALDDMLSVSAAPDLARLLTQHASAPVLVSPEPLLADQYEGAPTSMVPSQPMSYPDICGLIAERFGVPGVRWLWQPEETIGPSLDTPRAYSTSSERLLKQEEHKTHDVRHMNALYGELILRSAVARLVELMEVA